MALPIAVGARWAVWRAEARWVEWAEGGEAVLPWAAERWAVEAAGALSWVETAVVPGKAECPG